VAHAVTTPQQHRIAQLINAAARERLTQDGRLPSHEEEHSEMNEMTIADARAPKSVAEVLGQVQLIQQVMHKVMKEGVHYGVIPGTQAKSLWKPGAELLATTFRIAPHYETEDLSTDDEVTLRVKCIGIHQGSGIKLGEGLGQASSSEEKWKWKRASRSEFEQTPIERRRTKYGYNKTERKEYEIQQVRVEVADIANTVLKMACKRAQIAMTLTVLAAADLFSQDLEDLPEGLDGMDPGEKRSVRQPAARKAEPTDHDTGEARQAAAPAGGKEARLTTTQLKLLKLKMEEFRVDESEIEKQFGVGLDKLPMEAFNQIQDFVIGKV
jgi:hypothetical protein